jgi:D-arabinose 1-dehydrogenase-like Zn-dependent alcohol dehydrogenase
VLQQLSSFQDGHRQTTERNQSVSLFGRKTREEAAKLKAFRIHQHGGSDQLRCEDTPEPKIMFPGEVLVNLQAAALNHIDVWTRLEVTGMALPMPPILGADAAGIVIQAAPVSKG